MQIVVLLFGPLDAKELPASMKKAFFYFSILFYMIFLWT